MSGAGEASTSTFALVRAHCPPTRVGWPEITLAPGPRDLRRPFAALRPGILTLIGTGYAWLLIADDAEKSRREHRLTALGYGLGSALTLDEFALWLDLSDVYWEQEGRKSVEAVMSFGAVLSAGLWGAPFLREATKEVGALLKRF